MRTARLFLGVFALALILPLLLLACGGSDELADGASSERATVEPESRASSGQTTARPTTESAEPSPTHRATAAPTPAATAAPTMVQTSSETDREALIALYNATGGPNWNRKDNWLSDVPISEWDGVTTDDNGRVTALALNNNKLSGEIPPELGSLANLAFLYIKENQLSGCVPSSFSRRLNMEYSELGGLQFCLATTADPTMTQTPPETDREGLVALYNATDGPNWNGNDNWLTDVPISKWEGVATDNNGRVISLRLSGNQLSGEIPPELDSLTNLRRLWLSGNQLRGEIPPELSSLASLETLWLVENQLSGEIPPELGSLANLAYLGLSGNQLSGCVPSSLSGRLNMEYSELGGLLFCP